MELTAPHKTAIAQAAALLDTVAVRGELHTRPGWLPVHVAGRLSTGMKAVESFIRRILLLLALALEHEIDVDMSTLPYPKKHHAKQPRDLNKRWQFRALPDDRPLPFNVQKALSNLPPSYEPRPDSIAASPFLMRLDGLRTILADIEPRARRLAYTLARKRHNIIFPPGQPTFARSVQADHAMQFIYRLTGSQVVVQSRDNRPPPKGPRPRPPPRILFP